MPAPWRPEDCLLVVYAMYIDLTENFDAEAERGLIRSVLPVELDAFIFSLGSEWDAPLLGAAMQTPAIPGPDVYDLRALAGQRQQVTRAGEGHSGHGRSDVRERADARAATSWRAASFDHLLRSPEQRAAVGSNNWGSGRPAYAHGSGPAGERHASGVLRVPSTWYRARLKVSGADEGAGLDITGVTLPGTPLVTQLVVAERNLARESADDTVGKIETGALGRSLLPW
ncbi:MAG: hypothetical protein HC871_05735, partial [Rhizobiales bacterium]|nr:hypothetical protein [Hyphomicrobiales bacterium]